MEELNIKHLGRRTAYKPKLMYNNSKIGTLSNIYTVGEGYDNNDVKISIDYADGEHIWMFKPILRPLSDLTKPITHKGETFVPIYKLWELAGFEIGRGQYVEVFPNYVQTSNLGTAHVYKISLVEITSSNYNVIEKLLEWHFVIDEPEGTFIDVNTLNENPYK
jgi:hypothetical protein